MRSKQLLALLLAALPALAACVGENQAAPATGAVRKGGDDRNGEYLAQAGWWKPAPDHDSTWTWGEVSGVAVDNPNRIIVAVWGDRDRSGKEKPQHGSNYLLVVDSTGRITERWTQWDTVVNRPHQLYISPYDPERHVWLVERGGNGVHEQVIRFTNDGKQIDLRLVDPNPVGTQEGDRANPHPGPLDFGQPACLTFLPNGDFLLADGYWNGRIVRYNSKGEFVSEFGSVGHGPGQFDLVHGVAVDKEGRIYAADRQNNRVQVFAPDGTFIEEWPDVTNPAGIYIDKDENVWVVSATLNRLVKYSKQGQLLYHFGAYGGTRGGFAGGLSRPHQMDVDRNGVVYVASWDGGWLNRFVPRPGADPSKLVGQPLVLDAKMASK